MNSEGTACLWSQAWTKTLGTRDKETISLCAWLACVAQINRLAGIAVMLHCLLPTSWVPPLNPPTAVPPGAWRARRAAVLARCMQGGRC